MLYITVILVKTFIERVFIMDGGISKESVPIRVKTFRIKVISQNNCV